MIFPWLNSAWTQLYGLRSRLPHALLFQSAPGLGALDFAREYAQALLCESPGAEGVPCNRCNACNWFLHGNHPDFRLLQPDSLAPVQESDNARKRSDQIRIDQVRDLQGFLSVGTHRAGLRVILVHPAEAMNASTQNALLKSLEEPPPGTIFLLVTELPERLLPTVRSRCRKLNLPLPERASALDWLKGQGVEGSLLDAAGGAPLAALELAKSEADRQEFLGRLKNDGRVSPIAVSERLQRASHLEVVNWLQRWTYDLLAFRVAGRVRYHQKDERVIGEISSRCRASELARFLRYLGRARALAEHPLNTRLFFEDLLLEYARVTAPD